jgi:hypothetical protein
VDTPTRWERLAEAVGVAGERLPMLDGIDVRRTLVALDQIADFIDRYRQALEAIQPELVKAARVEMNKDRLEPQLPELEP